MDPVMKAALQRDKVTIDPSLRLYIPFNEGIGNVAKDYSQYGNNGVFTDVEWGLNGGMFNGTSAYVNCGNNSSLDFGTGNFTIEGWFKAPSDSTARPIIAKDPDNVIWWAIVLSNWGLIGFQFDDNDIKFAWTTTSRYDDNTWHHFAIARGTTYEIYLNGTDQGVGGTINAQTLTNGDNLKIGSRTSTGVYFNGSITGVKIYNRALSALEILTAYEAEQGRYGV